MKLTKNLKRVIVTQFKGGDDMAYLATLYGLPLERVEETIREGLIRQDNMLKAEAPWTGEKA